MSIRLIVIDSKLMTIVEILHLQIDSLLSFAEKVKNDRGIGSDVKQDGR